MNRLFKQTISAVMIMAIVLTMSIYQPVKVYAAEETNKKIYAAEETTVIKQGNFPDNPKVPIMPSAAQGENDFYDDFVKNDGYFDIADDIFGLKYDTTYTRIRQHFLYEFPDQLKDIVKKGQLSVSYRHSVFTDDHTTSKHWNVRALGQTAKLNVFGVTIFGREAVKYWPLSVEGLVDRGDYEFHNIKALEDKFALELDITKVHDDMFVKGCTKLGCGLPYIKNIAMAFVDMGGPSLVDVTVTDINNKEIENIKPGTSAYIHLKYDEAIRFAGAYTHGDNPVTDDIKLYLDVIKTENKMSDDTITTDNGLSKVVADFYALYGKEIVFEYKVPNTLGTDIKGISADINHVITSISASQPKLFDSQSNIPLALIDKDGKKILIGGETWGKKIGIGRTSSYITDLAGNAAGELAADVPIAKKVFLDSIKPFVKNVSISGGGMTGNYPEGLVPASALFGGAGDVFIFTAMFNEKLKDNAIGNLELNIKDSKGSPIELKVRKQWNAKVNEVDSQEVTFAEFEPLTITSDMTPSKVGEIIKATKISSNGVDLAGNLVIQNIEDGATKQTLTLDTKAPKIEIGNSQTNNKYSPIYENDTSKKTDFYFSIKEVENIYSGDTQLKHKSGVEGVKGSFMLKNNSTTDKTPYKFKYAVTRETTAPEPTEYKDGFTGSEYSYEQIGAQGRYIHIKLLSGDADSAKNEIYELYDTSLVVYPCDNAGNKGETVFPLNYVKDDVKPEIVQDKILTGLDSGSGKGFINVDITVNDAGGVSAVEYQWVLKGGTLIETSWVAAGISSDATTVKFTAKKEDFDNGKDHECNLYVRAKDTSGNEFESNPFAQSLRLTKPQFNLTVPSGISETADIKIQDIDRGKDVIPKSITLALIEDPEKLGYYFVRQNFETGGFNGTSSILSSSYINSMDTISWRYGKVDFNEDAAGTGIDDSYMKFTPGTNNADPNKSGLGLLSRDSAEGKRLVSLFDGTFYGELNVTVISGFNKERGEGNTGIGIVGGSGNVADAQFYNSSSTSGAAIDTIGVFVGRPIAKQDGKLYHDGTNTYETSVIGDNYAQQASIMVYGIPQKEYVDVRKCSLKVSGNTPETPYEITITPLDDIKLNNNWDPNDGTWKPGDRAKNVNNLNGVRFEVSITNKLMPKWGIDDMDKQYAKFTVSNLNGTIHETDITRANQIITVPNNAIANSGECTVKVQIKSIGRNAYDIKSITDIYVDRNQIGNFGLAKVETDVHFPEAFVKETGSEKSELSENYLGYNETGDVINPSDNKMSYDDNLSLVLSNPKTEPQKALDENNTSTYYPEKYDRYLYFTKNTKPENIGKDVNGELVLIINNTQYIKVWNSTNTKDTNTKEINEANKNAAQWTRLKNSTNDATKDTNYKYLVTYVDDAASLPSAHGDVTADNKLIQKIGVINGVENTISYQVISSNGLVSPIKTLIVDARKTQTDIELKFDPDEKNTTLVGSAMASISKITTASPDVKLSYVTNNLTGLAKPTTKFTWNPITGNSMRMYSPTKNWFAVQDDFGGYTFVRVKDLMFIDSEKPEVIASEDLGTDKYNSYPDVSYVGNENGSGFKARFDLKDNTLWTNGIKAYISYEKEYMDKLGLTSPVELKLPESIEKLKNSKEVASTPVQHGIYKVETSEIYNQGGGGVKLPSDLDLRLTGVFQYDADLADNADVTHKLTLTVVDKAGNSSESTLPVNGKNVKPAITSVRNEDFKDFFLRYPAFKFNTPVMLKDLKSSDMTTESGKFMRGTGSSYNYEKLAINNVYRDYKKGEFKTTLIDVFGNEWESADCEIKMFKRADLEVTYLDEPAIKDGNVKFKIKLIHTDENDSMSGSIEQFNDDQFINGKGLGKEAILEAAPGEILYFAFTGTPLRGAEGNIIDSSPWLCEFVVGGVRDVTPPELSLSWYYDEFATSEVPTGKTETSGKVTVFVKGNEPIQGVDGQSMSYTFDDGALNGASHTFNCQDVSGNKVSIVAVLPIDIKKKETAEKIPPTYSMSIMGKYDKLYLQQALWTNVVDVNMVNTGTELAPVYKEVTKERDSGYYSTKDGNLVVAATLDEIISNTELVSGYKLNFSITDDSDVKVLVFKTKDGADGATFASESDVIAGVTVQNTDIFVKENANFWVAVVDKFNNRATKPINFNTKDKIDTVAPVAKIEYKKTNFYENTAYLLLSDDKGNIVDVIVKPEGLIDLNVPGGSFDPTTIFGQNIPKNATAYSYKFIENGSVSVKFRDKAYNIDVAVLTGSNIDTEKPTAEVTYPPNVLTNTDVMGKLKFDKTIKSIEIMDISDEDGRYVAPEKVNEYVTIQLNSDYADVTYLKNVKDVEVKFTSLNGKFNTIKLGPVLCIDKTAPIITVTEEKDLKNTYATVTFTPNETVKSEDGKLIDFTKSESLKATFDKNGTYSYVFTDIAGNVTKSTVEVKGLDSEVPTIMLKNLPKDGFYTNSSFTFKATMSEAGKIYFDTEIDSIEDDAKRNQAEIADNGVHVRNITAPEDKNNDGKFEVKEDGDDECNWTEFTVSDNRTYRIKAVDESGKYMYAYLNVKCIDKIKPILNFNPSTIGVIEGTDVANVNKLLETGVTKSDNASSPEKITVTNVPFTQEKLNKPGVHEVEYTAVDEAGNIVKATRFVKVYSKNMLLLTINGKPAEPETTMVINTNLVKITAANLPDEPYTISVRKGMLTAGQMKTATAIYSGDKSGTTDIKIDGKGYYTIYVLSQKRQSYLVYVYIEE